MTKSSPLADREAMRSFKKFRFATCSSGLLDNAFSTYQRSTLRLPYLVSTARIISLRISSHFKGSEQSH